MKIDDYQADARKTAVYPDAARVVYPTLGLCGEAGEVAEKLLEAVWHGCKPPPEHLPVYLPLMYAAAAGKACELAKKALRDGKGALTEEAMDGLRIRVDSLFSVDHDEIIKENSDVLWYLANLAHDLGVTLSSVASVNLAKLKSRQERGVLGGSGDHR